MNKLTIRKEAILEAFVFLIAVFLCLPLILDVLSGGTTSNQGKAKKAPPPTPVPKELQQQEDNVFDDLLKEMDITLKKIDVTRKKIDDLSVSLDNFSAELDADLAQCEEDNESL